MEEQYMTEKQVAKYTGFALSTLRNWRHKRRGFPYIKEGRSIRYAKSDVDDYLRNKRHAPGN